MFWRYSFILFVCFLIFQSSIAQPLKVFGTITNTKFEPLPYASIEIKEEQIGKTTDANGQYEFTLREGKYDLVITMLGYKTMVVTIVLDKQNLHQNVMLETADNTQLNSIKISASKKDRGAEIIRQVIAHKDALEYPAKNYSCNLYIKAIEQNEKSKRDSSRISLFFSPQKIDTSKKKKADEYAGLNMAEVAIQYNFSYPDKIKQIKTGVKKYGDTKRLFYLNTTDGDFNFYKNLIYAKGISTTPFLSPFSYSGLIAYHFKLLQSYDEGGHHYYKIKISPSKLGNALVSGTAIIMDSIWVVKKLELEFPSYHLPQYDYFKVIQNFELQQNKWLLQNQTFTYYTNSDEGKLKSITSVSYKDYELQKTFPKKFFGNEIGYTTDSAYLHDSLFWKQIRTEPLQPKEIKFIRHTDSIYQITHSNTYLDSVDKATNKITFGRIAWNGLTFNNHIKERTIEISPVLLMIPNFLFIGGMRLGDYVTYQKRFPNKKFININSNITYGLLNKDFRGTVIFSKMYNPYHRSFYTIEVGHNFDLINFNDAYLNLFQRGNFYQDNKLDVTHSTELLNGFYMINELQFSMRSDLSNYKLTHAFESVLKLDTVKSDFANQTIRTFPAYNAFYNRIEFDYTPAQKYLHEPLQKIILGSRYPTFYGLWRKGMEGVFNSTTDFDYIEFGLRQRRTLGLAGILNINFSTGKFVNTNNLQLVDDKFMRKGDPFLFSSPTRNFQALDSSFALFNWYYELHVLQEFNGAIINKIPIVKKLKLLEVGGGGILYAPERNLQYAELFVGLEKIFRAGLDKFKIGFYLVGSAANETHHPLQLKIGLEKYNILRHSW